MWIFLPWGFYSVVMHKDDPEVLVVRARNSADIRRLAKVLPVTPHRWPARSTQRAVYRTPNADYPYRLFASRAEIGDLLSQHVRDLEYTNFKAAVRQDKYLDRLHDVWALMREHEDAKARRPLKPGRSVKS